MDAAMAEHYRSIWTLAHKLAELTAEPEAMTREDKRTVGDLLKQLRPYRAVKEN